MILGAVIGFLIWLCFYIFAVAYTSHAFGQFMLLAPRPEFIFVVVGLGAAIGYLVTFFL